jgi:hypothetical protein
MVEQAPAMSDLTCSKPCDDKIPKFFSLVVKFIIVLTDNVDDLSTSLPHQSARAD